MTERPTWEDWRYRRHHQHSGDSGAIMRLFGKPFSRIGGTPTAHLLSECGHRTIYVHGLDQENASEVQP